MFTKFRTKFSWHLCQSLEAITWQEKVFYFYLDQIFCGIFSFFCLTKRFMKLEVDNLILILTTDPDWLGFANNCFGWLIVFFFLCEWSCSFFNENRTNFLSLICRLIWKVWPFFLSFFLIILCSFCSLISNYWGISWFFIEHSYWKKKEACKGFFERL